MGEAYCKVTDLSDVQIVTFHDWPDVAEARGEERDRACQPQCACVFRLLLGDLVSCKLPSLLSFTAAVT